MERDTLLRDCHQRPLGSERVKLAFWKQQALGSSEKTAECAQDQYEGGGGA